MKAAGEVQDNVLFGKDGWLYLWGGAHGQFNHLMGAPIESYSISAFIDNVKARYELCQSRSVPYLHVVFPSKPTVMTEYLPDDMQAQVQSLYERHYAEVLRSAGCGFVTYPRALLVEEKERSQVFSRTDTHMTDIGCAVVARHILRQLGHDHDPLMYMEEDTRPRRGDLAAMAKTGDVELAAVHGLRSRTDQIWDNRRSLPSNKDNIAVSHHPHSFSSQRLLVLGDSFMLQCLTSLSSFYRDILYVRSAHLQPELLDMFSPDAVVTANAERYMCKVYPDKFAESVLMRGYGRPGYQPEPDFTDALQAQLSWKYYNHRYREWSARIEATSFEGVGLGKVNEHLGFSRRNPGWLMIAGKEARIIVNAKAIRENRDYRLRIVVASKAEGNSQLFIEQTGGEKGYLERCSVKKSIKSGLNTLDYHLPCAGRGTHLRFHPLDGAGEVRINEFSLHST